MAERQTHNLKVAGSSPAPATMPRFTCSKGHTAEQLGDRRGLLVPIRPATPERGPYDEICPLCYEELLRRECGILTKVPATL